MKWTPGTENDDVIDERGDSGGGYSGGGGYGGGGGGLGPLHYGGGGIGLLIIGVIVSRVLGFDVTGLFSHHNSGPPPGYRQEPPRRDDRPHPPANDPDKPLVDFVKFVLKDVQDTFETKLKAAGQPYRHAKLVLFSREIDTGCGRSSSAIGPFYCPADEHAYIDLSFYRELRQRFGAPGDFAQAYVLAHEIGHHLQKLFGTEGRARARKGNDVSVRIELQADCYAGVWGHEAQNRKILEAGDLEEAITAATAIGDDRLQREAGRTVNPETFTHGTSAQRVKWFRTGFDSGKFEACDTFAPRSSREL